MIVEKVDEGLIAGPIKDYVNHANMRDAPVVEFAYDALTDNSMIRMRRAGSCRGFPFCHKRLNISQLID
jgi:hypothetical protein